MNVKDSMDLINEIEEKFPVDQWIIDSIHIWPIIRIQLYFALQDLSISERRKANKKSPLLSKAVAAYNISGGILKYFYAYFYDFKHNAKPDNQADVIFLGDQVSRVLIKGGWYDRLCEPFIDYLHKRQMKCFHMDPYHRYRVPRNSASMFIQPYLDYEEIKSLFLYKKIKFSAQDIDRFSDFIKFLKSKNLDVRTPDIDEIKKMVMLIQLVADFFKKIVEKVNPSLAFLVEYYNCRGMAFNLACREFGIKTVDVPHGNHGDIHVAYGRWNKLPEKGYELLPSIFWCWSNAEADAIQEWTDKVSWHKPIVGGNLWLDYWQQENNELVDYYNRKVKEIKESNHDSIHILCTFDHKLPELLNLIKMSPPSWFWWIRMHPTKLEEREKIRHQIKQEKITNYEFINATNIPLYALLRHMDIHLTEGSSVIIEAESFAVPSVITQDYGTAAFPHQVLSGWALPAYTNEEIIKAIYHQLNVKKTLPRVNKFASTLDRHMTDLLLPQI